MIKVKPIFGAHQIYQEIVNYPPKGVKYIGVSNQTKKGEYYRSKKVKEFINRINILLKLPRMIFVKPGNYDLIHSSRGILPLNNKPWVMDAEHVFSFTGLSPMAVKNKFIKKFIEWKINSKNCKAILCHCEATRQAFLNLLDSDKFKDKIKVLYPAAHLTKIQKKKHKKIRVLCVLSLFEMKGGAQILEAFSNLEEKYDNIELWFKSDVPEELKKKYNSKNIKYFPYFSEIITRDQLLKTFYSECDVFLYPTLCDSFGYSLIDALVAGLPIIGSNLFAVPEVVREGKNGFVVKIPGYSPQKNSSDWRSHQQMIYLENWNEKDKKTFSLEIELALEKFLKKPHLIKLMGNESYKMVSKGDFSITKRNKILKTVYEEALK